MSKCDHVVPWIAGVLTGIHDGRPSQVRKGLYISFGKSNDQHDGRL